MTSSRWPQITHNVPRIAPMGARALINGTLGNEDVGQAAAEQLGIEVVAGLLRAAVFDRRDCGRIELSFVRSRRLSCLLMHFRFQSLDVGQLPTCDQILVERLHSA